MSLGDSLAKGLVRRWSREMTDFEDRVRTTYLSIRASDPGKRLRKIKSALDRFESSPWMLDPARIEGKRRRATLFLTTLGYIPSRRLFQIRVSSLKGEETGSDDQTLLLVTPHALQRTIQLIGEDDRRAVTERLRTATSALMEFLEEIEASNDKRFPGEISLHGEDCLWILDDADTGTLPYTLRTCIGEQALHGRLSHLREHTLAGRADSYRVLDGNRVEPLNL